MGGFGFEHSRKQVLAQSYTNRYNEMFFSCNTQTANLVLCIISSKAPLVIKVIFFQT